MMALNRKAKQPRTNILKYFIDFVTLNGKEAFGLRILLFQFISISITCFGEKGEDIRSGSHLFNMDLSFQLLPRLFFKRYFSEEDYIHFCDSCGPFVRGYSEIWEKGASGPYKIQFFQYCDGAKEMVDEIVISKHNNGVAILRFNFCGICNGLLENKFFTKNEIIEIMKQQRIHQF